MTNHLFSIISNKQSIECLIWVSFNIFKHLYSSLCFSHPGLSGSLYVRASPHPSPLPLAISWNQELAIAIAKAVCESNVKDIDGFTIAFQHCVVASGPFGNIGFGHL